MPHVVPLALALMFGGAFLANEWTHGGVASMMGMGGRHLVAHPHDACDGAHPHAPMHGAHAAAPMPACAAAPPDANATEGAA